MMFKADDTTFNKIKRCNLALSYQCMFRCKMCHLWQLDEGKLAKPDINRWQEVLIALDELSSEKPIIHFGGGEPLMIIEDVLKLIRLSKKLGYEVSIATNGYLLNEDVAKELSESGIDNICISLDSLDEKTHDYLRGKKGSYTKVMQAIEHFKKYPANYRLAIATLIAGINLNDIKNLVDWASKEDEISAIVFQAVVQPFGMAEDNQWYQSQTYKSLWPSDLEKVVNLIDNLIYLKTTQSNYKIDKISNSVSQLDAFKKYFKNPQIFLKQLTCNITNSGSFALNPDGNVFLCTYMEPIGNITNMNIDKIFLSDKAVEIKKRIRQCKKNCHMLVNCWYEDEKIKNFQE